MPVMPNTGAPDSLGRTSGPDGAIPGSYYSGIFLNETVDLERKISGTWSLITGNAQAFFEPMKAYFRQEFSAFTHKPLQCVCVPGAVPIQDGDRFHRGDGSYWYVRGTPLTAPMGTHKVAIVEGTNEDGMFAALTSAPNS